MRQKQKELEMAAPGVITRAPPAPSSDLVDAVRHWVHFDNLAETLQKQGGFIPGIRPGPRTESYLNGVLSRITLVGALFLGLVAIMPYLIGLIVSGFTGNAGALTDNTSLIISSTGLLIVVGVVLDTMKQIEAQLLMRNYEGFIR
jgi:preprotein translocase subunit SecY